MEDRVCIFIDGSNLYHALRDTIGRTDLNFPDFARKLADGRPVFRVYYYNALQDPNRNPDSAREQQEFLSMLRASPYMEVRLGTLKTTNGVTVEKGVDVMLATDVVHYAFENIYDTAIIVSGDADYAYALQLVKNKGKHVEVAYFENNISRELMDLCDIRHFMDRKYFEGLWTGRRIRSAAAATATPRRRLRALPAAEPLPAPEPIAEPPVAALPEPVAMSADAGDQEATGASRRRRRRRGGRGSAGTLAPFGDTAGMTDEPSNAAEPEPQPAAMAAAEDGQPEPAEGDGATPGTGARRRRRRGRGRGRGAGTGSSMTPYSDGDGEPYGEFSAEAYEQDGRAEPAGPSEFAAPQDGQDETPARSVRGRRGTRTRRPANAETAALETLIPAPSFEPVAPSAPAEGEPAARPARARRGRRITNGDATEMTTVATESTFTPVEDTSTTPRARTRRTPRVAAAPSETPAVSDEATPAAARPTRRRAPRRPAVAEGPANPEG